MKKHVFYTEFAYIIGLFFLAMSAALMEAANFGMSMVVAPAYLLYLKLSPIFSFFTFGMAEYTLQAILLIVLIIVLRKFKIYFLFSFVTAVIYGFMLDGCMWIVSFITPNTLAVRMVFFVLGIIIGSFSISCLFHTYIAPEVYELFVKEIALKYQKKIHRIKMCYDCTSCVIAIIMSFYFFGLWHFEGVKIGTIICAVVNGWLIGRFSTVLEKFFVFKDGLKLRKYFS